MTLQKIKQTTPQITDETILVVKRDDIFENHQPFNGLQKEPLEDVMEAIQTKKHFLPRSLMEQDQTYKQIIPYLVFNYADRFFLMQRQSAASEQRLKDKFTLGIGGHMRESDMQSDSVFNWAFREFHEEVHYTGCTAFETIGVLNDDSNDVGKVHLGLVLLVQGESPNITIKSELKSGQMLTLDDMKPYYDRMETWTQMVYDFLCKH
jgi:predicted NUDIX family phosphoesterase